MAVRLRGFRRMTIQTIEDLLDLHEGYRQFPYEDTVGKLTVGHGFNLDDVGLYRDESLAVLSLRVKRMYAELVAALPWVDKLDPVRKAVVQDMHYNLGTARLLGFKNTLRFMEYGDYGKAAENMLLSKWAGQVGGRARRLAWMMKEGKWPDGSQRF